jgi:hypothetical protein
MIIVICIIVPTKILYSLRVIKTRLRHGVTRGRIELKVAPFSGIINWRN